jgi:hypothetical protein
MERATISVTLGNYLEPDAAIAPDPGLRGAAGTISIVLDQALGCRNAAAAIA